VFSPYYFHRRRRAGADPLDHCAFNVSLSGRVNRWTMTERPRAKVRVEERCLTIGPSALQWDGSAFEFDLAEISCPLPAPLRGTVRVEPTIRGSHSFALDCAAQHWWSPLTPRARIEVDLKRPALRWRGDAYLDSNYGSRALEQDFNSWTWSRAALRTDTVVFYEPQHRTDPDRSLALRFDAQGEAHAMPLPPLGNIASSGWGISRQVRSEQPAALRLLHSMVDAPFYSRSLLATHLGGEAVTAVHESLSLERFRRPWVQWMLPFRMPRWPLHA
jgi:carotenoid 1,2-hydratase